MEDIIAPLMMGLAFCAPPIVRLILTEKWVPCVPYLRIFCITYMFYPIHTANLNAINAMGRSDYFLKLEIAKKVIGMLLLLLTMRISVMAIEKKHKYLVGGDIFVYNGKVILWGLLNCHRDSSVNPLVPVGKSYPLLLDEQDKLEVENTLQSMVDKLGIRFGSVNVELVMGCFFWWMDTTKWCCVLITYINIKGVKTAAILQKILTIIIAAVGMVLIIASIINGDSSNLDGQLFMGSGIDKILGNVLSIAMVAPFFLFGFDVIPQAAEEINIPLKKLGKLIVLSIALAVAFYGMVVFAVGYGMNQIELAMSLHGSGLVTADAMAKLFHSKIMAKTLILGGMCGIVTSWNSFLIGGSRALESMASSYMIPHVFCKKHKKYQTPYLSLILIGILSIISLFFGRQMLTWISNCASFACCLTYCIVSLSFLRLRKKEPELARPYKVKNYYLVGIMATVLSGFLCMMYLIPGTVCSMIDQELIITVLWTIIGIFFAVGCKVKYRDRFGK